MAIQIMSEPPPEPAEVAKRIHAAIEDAMETTALRVTVISPGHFEIDVVSPVFEGLRRVEQQQRVYAAIQPLMAGDAAPVHAIDRMTTRTS